MTLDQLLRCALPAVVASFYACGSEGPAPALGGAVSQPCRSDMECKGERVCVDGYCKNPAGSENHTHPTSEIVPLTVGNFWTYDWLECSGQQHKSYTVKVTGTQPFNGVTVFTLTNGSLAPRTRNMDQYYANRSEGLYLYRKTCPDGCLIFKYPTSVGDQIFIKGDVLEVQETSAPVNTPAGTFNGCVKYVAPLDGTIVERYTLCPSVGLVEYWFKYECSIPGGSLETSATLINFTLNR